MEPMVTINLERYNKLLEYEDMIVKLLDKSKKNVESEYIPTLGPNPKKCVFVEVNKPVLKNIYSKLLGLPQEDINVFLGD